MAIFKDDIRGTWYFKVRRDGNQITRRGFHTKYAAKDAEALFLTNYGKNSSNLPLLFKDLARAYLDFKGRRTRESSGETYLRLLNNQIYPYFGNVRASSITAKDIMLWENRMIDAKLSYKYCTTAFQIFKGIMTFGVNYYNLKSNPFLMVESFKRTIPKQEMRFFTYEQFMLFYSQIPEKDYRKQVMFLFLFFLGLRRGELQALRFNDVDLDNCTLSIDETVTRGIGSKEIVGEPKTPKSKAVLKIPNEIMPVVENYIKWCRKTYPKITGTLFLFDISRWLSRTSLDRYRREFSIKAGLEKNNKIRIHDFRHSTASYYLSIGVPLEVVKEIMRHESLDMTAKYVHVDRSKVESILSNVKVFSKPS